MITIRYADLPEGLHVQAEARGRRTVIYLRPGLTPEQRRHSLRRARQSGRMGYGPRLPAAWVAVAVGWDTVRGTLRNAAAAVRTHPLGSVLLAAGVAASMVAYLLLVTVSLRMILPPNQLPPRGPHALARPVGPGEMPGQRVSAAPSPTLPGAAPPPVPSATASHSAPPPRTPGPTPSPDQAPSPEASGSASARPAVSPSPSDCSSTVATCPGPSMFPQGDQSA
jgi:hypothetical protein